MTTSFIEVILFWLVVLDSVICNVMVWFGASWYLHHFRVISRTFPPSRGWATVYLLLVVWIGSLLFRMGALHI